MKAFLTENFMLLSAYNKAQIRVGPGGMERWLLSVGKSITLAEDPSSIPSTHMPQLTAARSRKLNTFFWPLWAPAFMSTYLSLHTHNLR